MGLYFFIFLTFSVINFCDVNANLTVNTSMGVITGYYKLSYKADRYKAFEGIPYALPPIGNLRFEPPVPSLPWKTEYFATYRKQTCWEYQLMPYYLQVANVIAGIQNNPVSGFEDCLYLNIYVPELKNNSVAQLLPVIIGIHGGSFQSGSSGDFSEKYIIDKEVIFATFNYRLGPLGFLSTEDDIVPGNMGLKDQNLAIRWIKNNILSFGGDPNNIILLGISAGATSVHYHYLSPMSRGLFQGGISLSGNVFSCWTHAQHALEKAKHVSIVVGCPVNNTKEMISCLREKPARRITQAVGSLLVWLIHPDIMFGPVVEKSGRNPFITKPPNEIINSGLIYDIPWVNSVVRDEGTWTSADFILQPNLLKDLNNNWNNILPALLDFNYTIPLSKQSDTSFRIRKEYFGSSPVDTESKDNVTKMIGDRRFHYTALQSAKMQAAKVKSPVWVILYSYRAAHSYSEVLSGLTENLGVAHTDDARITIQYASNFELESNAKDMQMQASILNMWKTFAYTKKLEFNGIECKKVESTKDSLQYCQLNGPKNVTIVTENNFGNNHFWESLNFDGNK